MNCSSDSKEQSIARVMRKWNLRYADNAAVWKSRGTKGSLLIKVKRSRKEIGSSSAFEGENHAIWSNHFVAIVGNVETIVQAIDTEKLKITLQMVIADHEIKAHSLERIMTNLSSVMKCALVGLVRGL